MKRFYSAPYPKFGYFSSSTPTVPYSTADILYGNEVRHSSPQLEELRQNSLLEFGKDKERLSSKDSGEQNTGRRPSSKGASRKSLSIEKVSFGNKESEDNLRPLLPSSKQNNQYRPNGMRNSLLRGEPSYSARNNVSGKETDDLIAMGTIWSPNTQQGQQGSQMAPLSNSSKSSNLAIANNMNGTASSTSQGIGRSIGVGTNGSSSTTTLSQGARKYNSAVKPILVQNAPSSGSKNSVDPKYTDPLIGAPASFQQRLMELSALEAETVRYERSKKVKKKVKQDRDS